MGLLHEHAFAVYLHDRASHLRTDEKWLAEARHSASTRVVVVRDGSHVLIVNDTRLGHLRHDELPETADVTFLGVDVDGCPVFAFDAGDGSILGAGHDALSFMELRTLATALPHADAGLAAQAVAMLGWHRRHQFCGVCGSPTAVQEAGHARRCLNCGTTNYPRTDPVVIMLVTSGDRCLLGRRSGRRSMWGPLSGFVEPGETPEAAVAREVKEEAGLTVLSATYRGSQPWPFPLNLMLAFDAEAEYGEIHINEEMEDARWFTRREIAAGLESGVMSLPSSLSVAHNLIWSWLDQ